MSRVPAIDVVFADLVGMTTNPEFLEQNLMRDSHVTPIETSAIDAKRWHDALVAIFEDLGHRFEPKERRIILEGLTGIYVRFEETAEQAQESSQYGARAAQICNVVHLDAYSARNKGNNRLWPD